MHPADVSGDDGSTEELFTAESAPKSPLREPLAVPSSAVPPAVSAAIHRLGVLFLQVSPQRGLVRVVLLAERALERRRPLPALERDVRGGAVPPVRRLVGEGALADVAGVGPRSRVDPHVDVEVVFGGDLGAAHGADERLLARVHPLVRRQ